MVVHAGSGGDCQGSAPTDWGPFPCNEEAFAWNVSGEGVDLDFDVLYLSVVIWYFSSTHHALKET